MAETSIAPPGFYNMDCMEALRQFPDQFFDLAIVDPPYGDGNSDIGGGYGSDRYSTDTNMEPIRSPIRPIQADRSPVYRGGWHGKDKYHLGLSEQAEAMPKSTAKKLSRGT